jgi:hypothetical protein
MRRPSRSRPYASESSTIYFKILDSTGVEIDSICGSEDFVAGSTTDGWQTGSKVRYGKLDIGRIEIECHHHRNIHIQLTTYDCSERTPFWIRLFFV